MFIFLLAVKQKLAVTLPKELFLLSDVSVISPCHLLLICIFFFLIERSRLFLGSGRLKSHLPELFGNWYEMHEFHIDFLVPGLLFDVDIYSKTLLSACPQSFCEYSSSFGRSTV